MCKGTCWHGQVLPAPAGSLHDRSITDLALKDSFHSLEALVQYFACQFLIFLSRIPFNAFCIANTFWSLWLRLWAFGETRTDLLKQPVLIITHHSVINTSVLPERSCFGNYRKMWHKLFDLMAECAFNKGSCRLCSLSSFVLLKLSSRVFHVCSFCVAYRVMQCCTNEACNVSFKAEYGRCRVLSHTDCFIRQTCSYRCSVKLLWTIKHLESSDQSLDVFVFSWCPYAISACLCQTCYVYLHNKMQYEREIISTNENSVFLYISLRHNVYLL